MAPEGLSHISYRDKSTSLCAKSAADFVTREAPDDFFNAAKLILLVDGRGGNDFRAKKAFSRSTTPFNHGLTPLPEAHGCVLRRFLSDKAFRRAVLRVDEDNVFRVASRCIERKKGNGLLKYFGQSMNDPALEEEQIAGSKLPSV